MYAEAWLEHLYHISFWSAPCPDLNSSPSNALQEKTNMKDGAT